MRVVIGSDHGGYELKLKLIDFLVQNHFEYSDVGCHSRDSVDYPDFAVAVAKAVQAGDAEYGIMIDGAGIGSGMAANKIPGIRAAVCNDIYTAGNAREHNNANVLVMGSMVVGPGKATQILEKFLSTPFAGGRHARRVEKINALDTHLPEHSPAADSDIRKIIQQVVESVTANPGTDKRERSEVLDIPALITEDWLREIQRKGVKEIVLRSGTIVTPLARDFARDHNIRFIK